jgi:hypothetical protein
MDCLNYNLLDEDFSNASDAVITAVAQGVGALAQGAGGIAQARATKEASKSDIQKLIETSCGGKRPKILPKKKREWDACAKRVQDEENRKNAEARKQELELEKQKLQTQAQVAQSQVEQQRLASDQQRLAVSDTGSGDKFLGMPKAVGITVAVVGGLALIVGGILIVRKLRK